MNIDHLVPSLSKCLPNIKYEFCTYNVQINSDSLNRIIKGCSNTERVMIMCSKIVIDGELDFGAHLDYTTHYLSFQTTGYEHDYFSRWKSNKDDLKQIVKAIKNSSLSNSLKNINMDNCGMSLDEIKQVMQLDHHGLGHIQVISKNRSPFEW